MKEVEKRAVSDLVEKYSDELFAYLVRYTGNRGAAEDILSDVFVKLLQNICRAREAGFNVRAWLYRVATNRAISRYRMEKVRRFIPLLRTNIIDKGSLPDGAFSEMEEGERVKAAISKLSDKLRSTLILNIYHEMTYEEISDALKINLGTVKSRINEAKRRIKELLEVEDG